MKRRLLIIAVFLLAGAVVNVAVAWGVILLLDKWDWKYVNVIYPPMDWPREVPDHWPQADTIHTWRAPGFRRRIYSARVNESKRRWASCSITTISAGWPCLSLEWEIWHTISTATPPAGWHKKGLPEQAHWRRGLPVPSRLASMQQCWARLPVIPRWLGFSVNTMFYAALFWLPFVVRRFVRVKRGRCPACAYPRGESDVCSECGKALRRRALSGSWVPFAHQPCDNDSNQTEVRHDQDQNHVQRRRRDPTGAGVGSHVQPADGGTE